MHKLSSGRSPVEIAIVLMAAGFLVMALAYKNLKSPASFTPKSAWYRWIYYRYYYNEEDEFVQMTEEEIKRYMKRAFFGGLLVFLNGLVILLLALWQ